MSTPNVTPLKTHHRQSIRLVDGLAAAVWNLDAVLEVAVLIPQSPVRLPLVVVGIELMFPRLVES